MAPRVVRAAQFQSTRPVRGATCGWPSADRSRYDFNPRAPCGARRYFGAQFYQYNQFQSTRPVRGATKMAEVLDEEIEISIHAPRAGRDRSKNGLFQSIEISIHAPRAGRDPLARWMVTW